MFSMTISWIIFSLSILGPRSWSQLLFLEKHCHHSSGFIYGSILLYLHISVKHDKILEKFEFERSRAKVKVTFAIF